jgi:hypothetical protein
LEERLRVERALTQRFREHGPIYLSDVERRYLDSRWLQLVVMQHYGVPTRLVDWSKSAWVAAYFAVCGCWDFDGCIYGFRRDRLEALLRGNYSADLRPLVWGPHSSDMKHFDEVWDKADANNMLFDPDKAKVLSNWIATYYCREAHFPRLIAQQGLFTFGSRPGLDHWSQIADLLSDDDCFLITIYHGAKLSILRMLNSVGLNGAVLFPGPDGIGRSLEGFARTWHLSPRPSQF